VGPHSAAVPATSLGEAFRAHLPADAAGRVPERVEAIEQVLDELVSAARQALPAVSVSANDFVAYLAARFPKDAVGIDALKALHHVDLLVACACERGDRAAIAHLEEKCLRDLPDTAGIDRDELRQVVRERLLVKSGQEPVKIATYSGRGALKSWVRAVAARAALNLSRRHRGETPLEEHDDRMPGEIDTENAHLRSLCTREFRAVFAEAFATLPPRDRTILRRHYVDGVTMDQIGTTYRVHRITVVRWVERARQKLASEVRRRLSARVRPREGEVESLVRFVRSQLELSLETHLSRG
jgi:RNA polymerase sigma-70 factor (ECF subfamily)